MGERDNMVTMHDLLDAQWQYDNFKDEVGRRGVCMGDEILGKRGGCMGDEILGKRQVRRFGGAALW